MDGVERHIFGRRSVARPCQTGHECRGSEQTDPSRHVLASSCLHQQDTTANTTISAARIPSFAEVRLRQDGADDTTLQDRGERHPAHIRCDDNEPNGAARERDEQARPSQREERSIQARLKRLRGLRSRKRRPSDQTPEYECTFERDARRVMEEACRAQERIDCSSPS